MVHRRKNVLMILVNNKNRYIDKLRSKKCIIMFHESMLLFTSVSLAVASATILFRAASTFKFTWIILVWIQRFNTLVVFSITIFEIHIGHIIQRTLTHVSFRRSNTYVTPAGVVTKQFTFTARFWEVGREFKK